MKSHLEELHFDCANEALDKTDDDKQRVLHAVTLSSSEIIHQGLIPGRQETHTCHQDSLNAYTVWYRRKRLAGSGKKLDRFEREDQAFFERVRKAYLELAQVEPGRMRIIDAGAELAQIRKNLERALQFP